MLHAIDRYTLYLIVSGLKKIVVEMYSTRQRHAHRRCLRHMKANMNKCFKTDLLLDKFYAIGSAPMPVEYYKLKEVTCVKSGCLKVRG